MLFKWETTTTKHNHLYSKHVKSKVLINIDSDQLSDSSGIYDEYNGCVFFYDDFPTLTKLFTILHSSNVTLGSGGLWIFHQGVWNSFDRLFSLLHKRNPWIFLTSNIHNKRVIWEIFLTRDICNPRNEILRSIIDKHHHCVIQEISLRNIFRNIFDRGHSQSVANLRYPKSILRTLSFSFIHNSQSWRQEIREF